jgi:hypothetical protein
MGLLDYFGLMTKKSFQAEIDAFKRQFMPFENWQLQTAEAERYTLPDPSIFGNQANLYRRLPAVFISVDIVSSAAALTEFSVARVIAEKEPKDIPNHPFEMLLAQPNPLDSRYEFLYGTIAYWMLNKNSYWWLNRADEFSAPDEIWVIPPHMIIPVPDDRMFLRGYYYYPGNGAEIFLPPHEIIHFKGFNPFSRFVGLSAGIESLMMLAQSYLGMTGWNTKLYNKSNGRLPGILSFEQMVADPVWEKIKSDTREAAENRDLLMLRGVGQGVNWQQAAASAKDMDFYTGLDKIDKVIMDVLAPGAYTMLFENANEANSRTGRATLNELAVYPKHVVMGEKITSGILPAYGSDKARPLVGHFEDIRVTDRQMELQEQLEFSKVHTLAEIREEFYGDDPLGDDRDELLPEQLKNYKSEADKELELEKQKLSAQNAQAQNNQPQQQMQAAENNPPAEQPKEEAPAKAETPMIDALGKFERYALRMVGKPMKFDNPYLPDKVVKAILDELKDCPNELAVKQVFRRERDKLSPVVTVTPAPKYDESALITLAKSLNELTATYKMQSQTYAPAYVSPTPEMTFNLPPTQNYNYFNPPTYEPPDTTINISNPVEAAKPPDVQISSPVTIHQTVEPAALQPVTINQTIEPAAPPDVQVVNNMPEQVTNIAVENKLPEQSAPVVNVENKVEPTPIKFDPTLQAPNVIVNNEIKTPKAKRERQKVKRDTDGNIEGTETEIDYEE